MIIRTRVRAAFAAASVAGTLMSAAAMAGPASAAQPGAGTSAAPAKTAQPATLAAQPGRVLGSITFAPARTGGRISPQDQLPPIECELFSNDPLWWPVGSTSQNPSIAQVSGTSAANCFFVATDAPAEVIGITLSTYLTRNGIITGSPTIVPFPDVASAELTKWVGCTPGSWQTHSAVTITPPPGYVSLGPGGKNTFSANSEAIPISFC